MEYKGQEMNPNGDPSLAIQVLYPGIKFSFLSLRDETITFCHKPFAYMLEINYCIAGRIGWHMENGREVYLGPGDLSLHTMDICANARITLPNDFYQGIVLWIDLKRLSANPPPPLDGSGVTGEFLREKFCGNGACTAITGNTYIQQIFKAFYETPESLRLWYQKIKVLELILALGCVEVGKEQHLTEYRSDQAAIIRQIHDRLTENLAQRISIELLAKQYLLNTTTLKNMFKSIYGTSIAAHIREHRMEEASRLLTDTDLSIAEIAAKVGYDSQSRFSSAFKNCYSMLPKEYRRKHTV